MLGLPERRPDTIRWGRGTSGCSTGAAERGVRSDRHVHRPPRLVGWSAGPERPERSVHPPVRPDGFRVADVRSRVTARRTRCTPASSGARSARSRARTTPVGPRPDRSVRRLGQRAHRDHDLLLDVGRQEYPLRRACDGSDEDAHRLAGPGSRQIGPHPAFPVVERRVVDPQLPSTISDATVTTGGRSVVGVGSLDAGSSLDPQTPTTTRPMTAGARRMRTTVSHVVAGLDRPV